MTMKNLNLGFAIVQDYSLATLNVINHSLGFGPARTCKTVDFSSQICSGLLFMAHTSYQSLGVLEWPTDISLTKGLMSGADSHHHFTAPISTHLKNHLWGHCCLPRCELPSALCGPGKRSRNGRGCTKMGRKMEDFHGSPAGRPTHRIQCSSSVLGAPSTPLTPAPC